MCKEVAKHYCISNTDWHQFGLLCNKFGSVETTDRYQHMWILILFQCDLFVAFCFVQKTVLCLVLIY